MKGDSKTREGGTPGVCCFRGGVFSLAVCYVVVCVRVCESISQTYHASVVR